MLFIVLIAEVVILVASEFYSNDVINVAASSCAMCAIIKSSGGIENSIYPVK